MKWKQLLPCIRATCAGTGHKGMSEPGAGGRPLPLPDVGRSVNLWVGYGQLHSYLPPSPRFSDPPTSLQRPFAPPKQNWHRLLCSRGCCIQRHQLTEDAVSAPAQYILNEQLDIFLRTSRLNKKFLPYHGRFFRPMVIGGIIDSWSDISVSRLTRKVCGWFWFYS